MKRKSKNWFDLDFRNPLKWSMGFAVEMLIDVESIYWLCSIDFADVVCFFCFKVFLWIILGHLNIDNFWWKTKSPKWSGYLNVLLDAYENYNYTQVYHYYQKAISFLKLFALLSDLIYSLQTLFLSFKDQHLVFERNAK